MPCLTHVFPLSGVGGFNMSPSGVPRQVEVQHQKPTTQSSSRNTVSRQPQKSEHRFEDSFHSRCRSCLHCGLTPAHSGQQIISAVFGKYLANSKGGMKPAVRLIAAKCSRNPDQLWEFHADGRTVSDKSSLCMGVPRGKMKSGSGVFQATCSDQANQRQQGDFIEDATVVLQVESSDLCMTFEKKSNKKRPGTTQVNCSESAIQRWIVYAVATTKPAASSFDVTELVREIRAAAAANLGTQDASGLEDYYSEDRLFHLYNQELVSLYQRAANTPRARQFGGSPFDNDVIVDSQDRCPLRNFTIETEKTFRIFLGRDRKVPVYDMLAQSGRISGLPKGGIPVDRRRWPSRG